MNYEEVKKDLFSVNFNEWVVAHCISSDVTASRNMNAGIAKIFRQKYPKMAMTIESYIFTGKAARYSIGDHVIYNLVPKQFVHQKAQGKYESEYYRNLENCLIDLKKQMIENNEHKLAMPKISSGLDRGDWNTIKSKIQNVFKDTDIEIKVCYL